MRSRAVLILIGMGVILCLRSTADADFIVTYTGTMTREGSNDPIELEGATFEFRAVYSHPVYIDNGVGVPILHYDTASSSFTLSGASNSFANGSYDMPSFFPMMPTLGGQIESMAVRRDDGIERLLLELFLEPPFGGDGTDAIVGDVPQLSHFPTSIVDPTINAQPANLPYTVVNWSITTVPEPSAFIFLTFVGSIAGLAFWRRRF